MGGSEHPVALMRRMDGPPLDLGRPFPRVGPCR